MNFRKQGLAVAAATITAAALLPGVSHASDGTITFNGMVTATTCDVSINGQGPSPTITLPTVQASALPAGATAGQTPFTFSLTNCTGGTSTEVAAYFEIGPNVNQTTGNLRNSGGTAANVEVGLLNSDFSGIPLHVSPQNILYVPITSGAATLTYIAQYVADAAAAAGPGNVNTSVTYSLTYQ